MNSIKSVFQQFCNNEIPAKSNTSNLSIKICNADDENVVIQLYDNNDKTLNKHRANIKLKSPKYRQNLRQAAGGSSRQHRNDGVIDSFYRKAFGPAIDETILVGLETFRTPPCQRRVTKGIFRNPNFDLLEESACSTYSKFDGVCGKPKSYSSECININQSCGSSSPASILKKSSIMRPCVSKHISSNAEIRTSAKRKSSPCKKNVSRTPSTSNSRTSCVKGVPCNIKNNLKPKETRYAITRVTRYDDFTTYEVLKSTKARPKVIPCVTENIFIVRKKGKKNT